MKLFNYYSKRLNILEYLEIYKLILTGHMITDEQIDNQLEVMFTNLTLGQNVTEAANRETNQ